MATDSGLTEHEDSGMVAERLYMESREGKSGWPWEDVDDHRRAAYMKEAERCIHEHN